MNIVFHAAMCFWVSTKPFIVNQGRTHNIGYKINRLKTKLKQSLSDVPIVITKDWYIHQLHEWGWNLPVMEEVGGLFILRHWLNWRGFKWLSWKLRVIAAATFNTFEPAGPDRVAIGFHPIQQSAHTTLRSLSLVVRRLLVSMWKCNGGVSLPLFPFQVWSSMFWGRDGTERSWILGRDDGRQASMSTILSLISYAFHQSWKKISSLVIQIIICKLMFITRKHTSGHRSFEIPFRIPFRGIYLEWIQIWINSDYYKYPSTKEKHPSSIIVHPKYRHHDDTSDSDLILNPNALSHNISTSQYCQMNKQEWHAYSSPALQTASASSPLKDLSKMDTQ